MQYLFEKWSSIDAEVVRVEGITNKHIILYILAHLPAIRYDVGG